MPSGTGAAEGLGVAWPELVGAALKLPVPAPAGELLLVVVIG
jgi:hypothetical protein